MSGKDSELQQLREENEQLRKELEDATAGLRRMSRCADELEEERNLAEAQRDDARASLDDAIHATEKPTVRIEFSNNEAAEHFISWLCGGGEQDYWEWMRYREDEEDGPITAKRFDYWNGTNDGAQFAKGLRVVAECGRFDDDG